MATIYQCPHRDRHFSRHCTEFDQGKRARCRGCKSPIVTITGHAIIAHHRGDGNYSLADAIRVFSTMRGADRAASRLYEQDERSDVVARFVIA